MGFEIYLSGLVSDAKCLPCLTHARQREVQTYLLAFIAQLGSDPGSLAELAKCFRCLTPPQLEEVKTYLLAVLSGLDTAPASVAAVTQCYNCLPMEMLTDIQTYLLTQDPAGPGITNNEALLAAAKYFHSLTRSELLGIQAYSLAVLAGLTPDPPTLMGLAKCMRCLPYPLLKVVETAILDYVEPIPPTSPRGSVPPADRPPRGNPYTGPRGGGVGRCTDNLTQIVPIITPTYAAGVGGLIQTIDLYFPRLCCQPGTYQVYGSNSETMASPIGIRNGVIVGPPASPGVTIAGVSVSGFAYLYYAARQVCKDGSPVSGYSNVVGRTWMPKDSMESYSSGASLNALNGGVNFSGAYVVKAPYLGIGADDDIESYADGVPLTGLNGGTGWAGPYST